MRKHGLHTTIVEIDPAVYDAARTYFGLPDPGEGRVFLEDARGWVHNAQLAVEKSEREPFDIIIHDCFSGGGVPSHIFTLEFWKELKGIVKPDGVVAVVSHPCGFCNCPLIPGRTLSESQDPKHHERCCLRYLLRSGSVERSSILPKSSQRKS